MSLFVSSLSLPFAWQGQPGKMYIAFRGMRNAGRTPQEDYGASHDRASFIRISPAYASWLRA